MGFEYVSFFGFIVTYNAAFAGKRVYLLCQYRYIILFWDIAVFAD